MSELEDWVREEPSLDRGLDGVISRFKEVKYYMEYGDNQAYFLFRSILTAFFIGCSKCTIEW